MSANTDKEIADFFDRCAEKRLMYEFEPEEQQKLEQFLVDWNLQPGCRVLEPGCGSGRFTRILAEAVGPQGEVRACDLSPAMIRLARERGLPPQVRFEEASVLHLDVSDGWFDAVICLNVFPHFADKKAVLAELARVLRPGGALWINHFRSREGVNEFHHGAGHEVADHKLPCPHAMAGLLEETGFELLDITDIPDAYSLRARRRP